MPDDLRPEDPSVGATDESDARDERIAGLLAVDPLDEVTRRRLVSTALPATSSRSASTRRMRQLAAAAAVVFVAVAGVGVFAAVEDGSKNADDAVTAQGSLRESSRALDQQPRAPAGSSAAVPDIGDFGELSSPANLARLDAAASAPGAFSTAPQSPPAAAGTAGAATTNGKTGGDTSAVADAAASPASSKRLGCTPSFPAGSTVAVATGTYEGDDVVVFVRESANGTRVLYAVDSETCKVRRLP